MTLTILAALVGVPAAAQVGFQGWEPGTVVPVDIRSGAIQESLPFDVDFFFAGTVDADVLSLDARALGYKELRQCDDVLAAIKSCPSPGTATEVVDCYHQTRAALDEAQGGKQEFEVLVTALEPNRYYCFEFQLAHDIQDPQRIARLQTTIENALTAFFDSDQRVVTDPATGRPQIQQGAAIDLRRWLIQQVGASLASDEALEPEPGTYFDASAASGAVGDLFQREVARILQISLNLLPGRRHLRDAALPAAGALEALSTSPLWQTVAQALREGAAEPRVAQLLDGERLAALGLIGLPPEEIVARSEGRLTEPGKPLEAIWDPAQLNFSATRDLLAALLEIARALAADPTLRQAAGLTDDRLAAAVRDGCDAGTITDQDLCPPPAAGTDEEPTPAVVFDRLGELVQAAIDAFDKRALTFYAEDLVELLTQNAAERARLVSDLATKIRLVLLKFVGLRTSTVANYETRATWYISADLGGGLAWDLEEVFTYAGANIYFRPVNKRAHLRWSDFRRGQRWSEFRKRFSVMVGLPYDDVVADDPGLESLIQGRPALVAAGLRVSDYLRLSLGGLIFEEKNPDPLVDEERLAWSPFLSLSIDWNIAGTFKTMFSGIFGQQPAPQGGSP